MVNFTRYLFGIFLVFTMLCNVCFAAAQLVLFTDKTETELGRPLRVELYGIALKNKLTEIDLNALKKEFGVVVDYSTADTRDARWPNKSVQIMRFKLYPRQAGKNVIPVLSIDNIFSQKKIISVSNGKTSIPDIRLSSNKPYEQQQFLVHFKLISANSTARLKINENSVVNGFESLPLPFERIRQENGTYLLQTGWALTALKSGPQQLELPPVEYSVRVYHANAFSYL